MYLLIHAITSTVVGVKTRMNDYIPVFMWMYSRIRALIPSMVKLVSVYKRLPGVPYTYMD